MQKGIAFTVGACFIWSFIYIIPQFITGFSSFEIALGRYVIYGLASLFLFVRAKSRGSFSFPKEIWIKSIYFSLICTIAFYTFLVLAMRYATAEITAMILGLAPITIAVYGNLKQKEIAFRKLFLPSLLIFTGLLLLNSSHLYKTTDLQPYLWGLVCAFLSLASWTWYVEANSHFLKNHPQVPSDDWCTLIGIGTLFWVAIFFLGSLLFTQEPIDWSRYTTPNINLLRFIGGSLVLGILCSWVAEYLWNQGSLMLPVSLVGQLTILETVFVLLMIFLIDFSIPPLLEISGIILQLIGVYLGIAQFAQQEKAALQ